MSIEAILYLISVFDSLTFVTAVIVVVFLVSLVPCGIIVANCLEDYSDQTRLRKAVAWYLRRAVIVFIPALILLVLVPSERTMYLMMGSHYLSQSGIPSKVEAVLSKKLDEYLVDEPKKQVHD